MTINYCIQFEFIMYTFYRPHLWYKCFRDGLTLERMHQAFQSGLMEYGMMTGVKALNA